MVLESETVLAAAHHPEPRRLRWSSKFLLCLLSAGLLTLAFAPLGQFYFAWVGLAPWLIMVSRTRRARGAFWWSWLAGIFFFAANMWWLTAVTWPGAIALIIYLALYFGAMGWIIRVLNLLDLGPKPAPKKIGKFVTPPRGANGKALCLAFLVALLWTGAEWTRGTLFTGLPWLFLGYTQTPCLALCQCADLAGVYGVSLALALVNVLLAMAVINRTRLRDLWATAITAALLVGGMAGYGVWRMGQSTLTPGPTVLVVQSNYPQSNSGSKGADLSEILDFHVQQSTQALARGQAVDLIIWSETMMPPLNAEARTQLQHTKLGELAQTADEQITRLARTAHAGILTGTDWDQNWHERGDYLVAGDRRNSAVFYNADGSQAPQHYDKIHLVPFGEYTPFKDSVPILYQALLLFNPYEHPEDNNLTAGNPDALTTFTLADGHTRFVTPICFEDIDPALVGRMLRPGLQQVQVRPGVVAVVQGTAKRADFLVNITNDGWFRSSEMPQHLQAAIFRSIENRAPTARSVNTGISGFIDSLGRTSDLIPAGVAGSAVHQLTLDSRLSVYTQYGDSLAQTAAAVSAMLLAASLFVWRRRRVTGPRKG